MSYTNSPSLNSRGMNFSDKAKKNQIILKLKQEILEQKQKEDEYIDLSNEVKALESRLNDLTLEKEKAEHDQKTKSSSFLKSIFDLKSELDSIQSAFRQRKIEYQELEGENLSLSQMNEIKYNEISRLKMEMKAARDKNLKLKEHKQLNNQSNHKFLREKNEYEQEILNLSKEIETLKSKNYDDERKIQEYEFEIQRNETFNFQGQKSNKSIESETTAKNNQLEGKEKEIQKFKFQIEKLQKEISRLENRNEDIKEQIIQTNQNIQKEKGKEMDLETQSINLDKMINKKQQELENQDKNFEETQEICYRNNELNEASTNDYNVLVNHLNLLVNEKENILNTLSRLLAEDDNICKFLDMKFAPFNRS